MDGLRGLLCNYQRRWVDDLARFAIAEKSRQVGFTWAEALRAVLTRLGTSRDYQYIAQNEKTAIQFIRDCKRWAAAINAIVGSEVIDLSLAKSESLTFPGGNLILALTSSPDAARSKKGDMCFDEFAFHADPEGLFGAAFPLLTRGGSLRIISTHAGTDSYYNHLVREWSSLSRSDPDFSHHRVTIHDALEQGFAETCSGSHHKIEDAAERRKAFLHNLRKGVPSQEMWEREYECVPMGVGSTLITYELWKQLAILDTPASLVPRKYGPLYVGIDVGGHGDLTVAWVLEEVIDPQAKDPELATCYRSACVLVIDKMGIPAQTEVIDPILAHPSVEACDIDLGATGRGLSDYFTAKYPFVQGVSFGLQTKAKLAEPVRGHIQQGRIALPRDERIGEDLRCVGFDGRDYTGRSSIGHGDCLWALALALQAARRGKVEVVAWGR